MMNRFKIYYDAQKNGDILAMESIENDFCGVFLLLGKTNYYELCLSQVERRYKDATYGELHEVRLNSSCRYRKDTKQNVYTMHVLDELMENVNYWTKCLPLGNDQESWVKHSPNVMAARRCLNFVNNEYRRGLLDFESAIDTNTTPVQKDKEYTHYVTPRCTLERSRLFELVVTLFDDEIEGRCFNNKVANSTIDDLTTKLKRDEPEIVPTPLEEVIDSINNLNNNVDNTTCVLNNNEDDLLLDCDDDDEDDDDGNDSIDRTIDIVEKRSDCHRLSLFDVIEKGKDKMKESNIAIHRKNMKIMTDCHDNFLMQSFHSILEQSNNGNNFPASAIETNPITISSFISDFDKLKKDNISNAIGFVQQFNTMRRN